jgi:hypothetical protein
VACSLGFRSFLELFADIKKSDKPRRLFFSILGFKQAIFEIGGALRLTASAAKPGRQEPKMNATSHTQKTIV